MNTQSSPQLAKKILCIGGSTFNTGTPTIIKDALQDSNFLDEWTVIFANHDYFRCFSPKFGSIEHDKSELSKDFGDLASKLVFLGDQEITQSYHENVYRGKFYIIPDSRIKLDELIVYTEQESIQMPPDDSDIVPNSNFFLTFLCYEGFPVIEISTELTKNSKVWLQCWNQLSDFSVEDYDASDTPRLYQPCIDKIMAELAIGLHKHDLEAIAGLVICGKDADGAFGLQAIKKAGGSTAVQIPGECKHIKKHGTSEMPKGALKLESHCEISLNSASSISDTVTLVDWLNSIK